jgi:hypothetical protein
MKFISIKTVFADILTTLEDNIIIYTDVIEWASHALGQLDVYEFHSMNVAIRKITDYQTYVPDGTLQINQIMYKKDHCLDKDDLIEIESYKSTYEEFENKYLITERTKDWYNSSWIPLKSSTNNFMSSVLCANSPNFNSKCSEEFTVLPTGKILTTFKEGYIIISYLSAPVDDEGYGLLPNDDELIETLRHYVMSRIWEKRWNRKEEGSAERFQYYLSSWNRKKAIVRGKFKLPSESQQINIINNSNSLLPKSQRYFNGFGSFGNSDKTFF